VLEELKVRSTRRSAIHRPTDRRGASPPWRVPPSITEIEAAAGITVAILKATNVCATEPEQTARILVDQDVSKSYEYTLQALKDLPYNRWRELDATDAVRFWSLRLYEAGLIKSGPNKILAQGTDWRFLNELKKELKG